MPPAASGESESVELHRDDLVDDRELAAVTDDRLAHAGIVDQLAALATSVQTPSNIALYGPWGSGKSGIANLLRGKIDGKKGVRCVRFDAFKYADVPLRRNFISAVATELTCTNRKYHDDLYSGRTKTEVTVPPATIGKLLGVFALLLLGLAVIIGAIVAIAALVQSRVGANTAFGGEFRALSKQVVLAGLVPAALLAALISLASKTFSIDRSIAKPESDEQFEELFRQLVDDTGAKRLVVFVDELDRCSASEVVATLDTVRTFLGIDRCVFIIAADQTVLEEALTIAAKQETPADDANPYYSTGSAYLDKVFQYQLSLPPLLTQSISNYATTLVQGRGGLWGDINTEYVLSVLIPTHVTSPRRVKHLLNAFALAYRLAQERYRAGLLAEDPVANAASIARLACLRVEFPLFARHLEVAPNLPSLVLQLMRDENATLPSGTSDRARELAHSYALEQAAPSTVLVNEDDDDDGDDDGAERTLVAHNKQLLNYLSRTRQVNGPSRDFIYMHSTGTVFGLDGDLALAIERAAEDADIDTLQQRISSLDEEARTGVMQLLADQIRTGTGVTGPNAARSFLLLIEENDDLPVGSVVDSVAQAICVAQDEGIGVLDEDTVTSAWALAKAGSEASAAALRQRVLSMVTGVDWTPPDFIFDDAVLALETAPTFMSDYLAARLVADTGPDTVTRIFQLSDDNLLSVVATVQSRVAVHAREAATAHSKWKEAQAAAAATPAATPATAATATATATDDEGDEPFNPSVLFDAFANAAQARETPVQHRVLELLLSVGVIGARHAARRLIGHTEPTEDSRLAASILTSTRPRLISEWPAWLAGIKSSAIAATHAQAITSLVANAWSSGDIDEKRAALDALAPLIAALPAENKPNLTPDAHEEVEPAVESNDEATKRRELLSRARLFADAGVLDYRAVMSAIVESIQDTLAASVAVAGPGEPLYEYVLQSGTEAIRACSVDLSEEHVGGILSEARESPWLNDLGHVELTLELAKATDPELFDVADLPAASEIADAVVTYGSSAAHAASLWIELVRPGPDNLVPVFENLRAQNALSDEIAGAVRTAQTTWAADQQRHFLHRYLAAPEVDVPSDLILNTIGLARTDDADVADLLCQRFVAASNNAQRQSVITLWSKASIKSNRARRKLVETVIYGLLDIHTTTSNGNVGAADMAFNALNTLGKPLPQGVKGALGQRVKAAVTGIKALEQRALAVMPELGYSTTKGFLGRPKKVDFDDE